MTTDSCDMCQAQRQSHTLCSNIYEPKNIRMLPQQDFINMTSVRTVRCKLWLLTLLVLCIFLTCPGRTSGERLRPRRQQHATGQSTLICGKCDQRKCPFITPASCPGIVVKDSCNCCPVCQRGDEAKPVGEPKNDACNKIRCPRNQVCVLNIQGIPLCRCPTTFWCRRTDRHDVCGRDAKTYKSRCHLRITECISNRKIRVAHKGPCAVDGQRRKQKGNMGKANNKPNHPKSPRFPRIPNNDKSRSKIKEHNNRRLHKERIKQRTKRRYKHSYLQAQFGLA